jgi:hypothetical protein
MYTNAHIPSPMLCACLDSIQDCSLFATITTPCYMYASIDDNKAVLEVFQHHSEESSDARSL